MRKIIFSILALSMFVSINAQFKASKDGIITESGDDFYVVSIEGKTAGELFRSVNSYILSKFRNPDAVSNKADNSMINMHGVFEKAFPCKKWMGTHYADVDLNLIMYFKDGKLRFDPPAVNKMICETYKPSGHACEYSFSGGMGGMMGESSLFKKNGDVKNKLAVEGINEFINKLVADIIEYAKQEKNDDW